MGTDMVKIETMVFQKQFIRICLLPILLLTACKDNTVEPLPKPQPPNIIYILADDLGYGDIGIFNPQGKIKTPNIDGLARAGIRFTDAHSGSAVCTPTRYGILTGRSSWRSPLKWGVVTGKSKALIPKERMTVAKLLKSSGYHTAFIGKWHLGWDWGLKDSTDFGGDGWKYEHFNTLDFTKGIKNGPNALGFDYAYGLSGSLDMAPYVYVENGKVTAAINRVTEDTGKYTWWRKGPTAQDFIHNEVTPNFFERSMDYVKAQSESDAPFFLYLALPSPHTPILPTKEWQGKSGINYYADFMMQIDDYVGRLLDSLESAGLSANTMVVFASDNGPSPESDFEVLAAHGHDSQGGLRGHKADIYEGGHRIPFVVKWPGVVQPNTVSHETVSLNDFMATCAAILGTNLEDDQGEDSFSLLPLLSPNDGESYQREATIHHSVYGNFAIRKGPYKLIFVPGSGGWSYPSPDNDAMEGLPPYQLYDLEKDPKETINLVDDLPQVVKDLKGLMVDYIEAGRSTPGSPQKNAKFHLNGDAWHQLEPILEQ